MVNKAILEWFSNIKLRQIVGSTPRGISVSETCFFPWRKTLRNLWKIFLGEIPEGIFQLVSAETPRKLLKTAIRIFFMQVFLNFEDCLNIPIERFLQKSMEDFIIFFIESFLEGSLQDLIKKSSEYLLEKFLKHFAEEYLKDFLVFY